MWRIASRLNSTHLSNCFVKCASLSVLEKIQILLDTQKPQWKRGFSTQQWYDNHFVWSILAPIYVSWNPSPLTQMLSPYHCLCSMNGCCKLCHLTWSANQSHNPDNVSAWFMCLKWSAKDWRAKDHKKASYRLMITSQRTDPSSSLPPHPSHPPILPVSIPSWMSLCVFLCLCLVPLPPLPSSCFPFPLKSGPVSPVKSPPTQSSSPKPPPSFTVCSDNESKGQRGSQSSDLPVFPSGSRPFFAHNLKTQFLSQT